MVDHISLQVPPAPAHLEPGSHHHVWDEQEHLPAALPATASVPAVSAVCQQLEPGEKKNIFLIQMFSTQGRKVPHNFDSSEASGDEEDEGEAVEDMDF